VADPLDGNVARIGAESAASIGLALWISGLLSVSMIAAVSIDVAIVTDAANDLDSPVSPLIAQSAAAGAAFRIVSPAGPTGAFSTEAEVSEAVKTLLLTAVALR
jgi:hypothetical protein